MASLKYWLWLTGRRGLKEGEALALLEQLGTPEGCYFADQEEYALAGVGEQGRAALGDKDLSGAERVLADCERLGLRILTIQDAEYPERLRQIADPPCVLYVRGRLFAFDEECAVGVVGTRSPSEYGKRMAGRLGLDLARSGALVVSGIAQGLDAAALKGALGGGGNVVSVLGCGIDVVFPPQHRWLYQDVAAAGALISEYPPGAQPLGWHFPARNRILSGLCAGVAAVECAEHSGTLITARLALEQNREVFAVPGPADAPMSRGTNLLIQRGEAKLILDAWDILCELAPRFPGKLACPPALPQEAAEQRLKETETTAGKGKAVDKGKERAYITLKDAPERFTDDQRDILLALGERTLRADDLIEATQIPARRVSSALTMLQVQGLVEERPGKRFESTVLLKID